ncbi:hypothetical protein MKW98_027153, partial [Papaver atlanticum]
ERKEDFWTELCISHITNTLLEKKCLYNVQVTFLPQLPRVATVRQVQTNVFIDVPIQLQTRLARTAPSHILPQIEDDNLFDVQIQEDIVEVPVQLLETCSVPSSSSVLGKRPHEDDEILRAPLGTFNASTSTSSTGKKRRTSHPRRRLRFTPITLPRSPEVRAVLRSFNAARMRAMRNQNHATEPVLRLTASAALRQRKLRASCTTEQRILARSINTLQQRISHSRLSHPTSTSYAQMFRKAIHELE